jgi:hypothetical protein
VRGRLAALPVALLLLAATAPHAQPMPAEAASCLAALEAAEGGGAAPDASEPPRVGEICGDELDALGSSIWNDELMAFDIEDLSRTGLEQLTTLAQEYDSERSAGLSFDRLDARVAELEPFAPPDPKSLWTRLGEWVETWFRTENGEANWLGRLLQWIALPAELAELFVYATALLLGVAVVAIVVNELRASGYFGQRRDTPAGAVAAARKGAGFALPDYDAIRETADVRRRIELVFAIVVDRLRQRQRGLLSNALTHREIDRHVDDLDASALESLREIGRTAERVTYSTWQPDDSTFERIYAAGKSLLASVEDNPETAT